MKSEDIRIGQWVTVSFTGQIEEVSNRGRRVGIIPSGGIISFVPVESVEILSGQETLAVTE